MAPVFAERHRVIRPHPKRGVRTLSEDALRHGNNFALHRLGFFEALELNKGIRVVVGSPEGSLVGAEVPRVQKGLEAKHKYITR